jgi:hypothetical protein
MTSAPRLRLHFFFRKNSAQKMQPLRAPYCHTRRRVILSDRSNAMNILGLYTFSGFDNPAIVWVLFSTVITMGGLIYSLVLSWIKSQRKEREAYYKAEAIRRIAEMPGEGAKLALEHLLGNQATNDNKATGEDETQKALKTVAALRLAGTINIGVGIALAIFMYSIGAKQIAVAGLFPGIVGIALLLNAGSFAPKPPSSQQ